MRRQYFMVLMALLFAVALTGSASAVTPECEVGVNVTYEFADDNTRINPDINYISDENGEKLNFTKRFDPASNMTKITFQPPVVTETTRFTIKITAPGYKDILHHFTLSRNPYDNSDPNYYAHLSFKMNATDAYRLGREITKKADEILNFSSGNVLVITTAGIVKYRGDTSEDVIEGILNQARGIVTYGKGNLLMIRKTPVDPLDTFFILQKGNTLTGVFFKNASTTPVVIRTVNGKPIYTIDLLKNMTEANWNLLVSKYGEHAFPVASLANAWMQDAPADLLRAAAFHGHMCLGTISGYAMSLTLLKYYPPIMDITSPGSPGEITNYITIGVPGDSDDDSLLMFLDTTPGKGGSYSGFNTTATGADTNLVGFIRWNPKTLKGDLIIMKFDKEALRQQFQQETGKRTELEFNAWLISKLKQDPTSLVTIVRELTDLNVTHYYYLLGSASNTTVRDANGNVYNISAQRAHGLDMAYIDSLGLPNATRENNPLPQGTLTYEQIKKIGADAANLAKQLFLQEKGINLEKDDRDLVVLTSAGYSRLNGQDTSAAWDGIFDVLGSRLSRATLLPIHRPLWKPLWFTFVLRGYDGVTMDAVYIYYDPATGQLVASNASDGKYVNDIGPRTLNSTALTDKVSKVFAMDGWFNIQTIANAWRHDPPYDQILTFLFHDHACPGVSPGYIITEHIFNNYPLNENESYIYLGNTIYCKDDAIVYRLGVSPGQGTYFNLRLPSADTMSDDDDFGGSIEGILIIWDSVKKVGRAVIIGFQWPQFDVSDCTTDEAKREKQIAGFISLYKGETPSYMTAAPVVKIEAERYITESELQMILSGADGGSPLAFVKGIPADRTLADILPQVPVDGGNQGGIPGGVPGGLPGGSTGGVHGSTGTTGRTGGVSPGLSASVAAPAEVGAASESTEEPAPARAYEVENVTSSGSGSGSSAWYVYGIVGVLVAAGLVAFGFLRGGAGK
ncbi:MULTISPECIES: FmdE family protein [Methanothermobacter]|uniref:FmdE family protein n=1 Tax=Methanothermobacter wolfeii TaxID=145261 RepID=A0A9E7RTD5_METWO|nr:FmdE family protein [Methanothermobacter wolfeii]UXH30972.1 FmdE family protein [Methanothermobacter wolfeii]